MRRQNDAATFELTWPHDEFGRSPSAWRCRPPSASSSGRAGGGVVAAAVPEGVLRVGQGALGALREAVFVGLPQNRRSDGVRRLGAPG